MARSFRIGDCRGGFTQTATYHPDRKRWRRDDNHAYLRGVGRGQEFVLDLAHYPEAVGWLSVLLNNLRSNTRD